MLFVYIVICCAPCKGQVVTNPDKDHDVEFPYEDMEDVLPGTRELTWELTPIDLSKELLNNAHKFIDANINESITNRQKLWQRDLSSREAYEKSVEPNRRRLMKMIGFEDKSNPFTNYNVGFGDKNPPVSMQRISTSSNSEMVAETPKYRIYQVRWPVLKGVYGEGLLLEPKTKPIANIVALPDADQTPEQLVGLSPGIDVQSQFARRLAENGYQVLVPVLISRSLLFEGTPKQKTYRDWIYSQAFHMGRHVIGYEVQKVVSAIDWFKQSGGKDQKIGVVGYAEGGLIAFHSAAIDKRIDAVLVSGYYQSREKVWEEPIYRNIYGLLAEFGDAEIASLIAPRPLVIEHSKIPEKVEKNTKKPLHIDEFSKTGYKGSLKTPLFKDVNSEFDRIDSITKQGFQSKYLINDQGGEPIEFGSKRALERFVSLLGDSSPLTISNERPHEYRNNFNPEERQIRQVAELEDHVQWLLRISDQARNDFFLNKVMPEFKERQWSSKAWHPYYSPDRFIEQGKGYRKYLQEHILGKFEDTKLSPNAQTRKVYNREKWTGYEVVLDVYSNLNAAGILLLPKDLKAGERRPVVVCQVGRNGLPQNVIEGSTSYNDMAAKLVDQGFIVFTPYVLYNGEDRYRWLDRKANTIKKTLFSFIIAQHEQILHWLGELPYVDKNRIAFYGKSYGGETAMRVPSVLEGYCLSICSGDFGDWTAKVVDTQFKGSFVNTIEWEMPYFNMGNTFSYAEMAYLIFPRPFMVERGHDDLVQPDSWVASEFAKVRYLYAQFNSVDRIGIQYFNGGHASKNDETFKFLHKHLNWP